MKTTSMPNTFTYFPLLPPELRLKIWGEAAHIPRCIPLSITSLPSSPAGTPSTETAPTKPFHYTTSAPLPTLLCTTLESRQAVQRIYKPSFHTSTSIGLIPFNKCHDIVVPANLRNWTLPQRANWLRTGVHRVAINVSEPDLKSEEDGRGGGLPFLLGVPVTTAINVWLYSVVPQKPQPSEIVETLEGVEVEASEQMEIPRDGEIGFTDFASCVEAATKDEGCEWSCAQVDEAGKALTGAWEKFDLDFEGWVEGLWEDHMLAVGGEGSKEKRKTFGWRFPKPKIELMVMTVGGKPIL